MEILIGLVILVGAGVVWYFNNKKMPVVSEPEPKAPYKLEPPQPVVTAVPVVEEVKSEPVKPAAKKAPAKKTAKAKPAAKKTPAAKKAPAPKKPTIKVVK